jgi:hypothetical protein
MNRDRDPAGADDPVEFAAFDTGTDDLATGGGESENDGSSQAVTDGGERGD